jgi:UDP-N-acetylglucosamine:LPS N-acetylglucosamine transferase
MPLPQKLNFFAYLASDSRFFRKAVLGLAEIKLPGGIFIRSAQKSHVDFLRQRQIHVHDKPAPIAEVLANASAIIHHGGIGTTEVALGLGRPQVLLPRHLEQQLTARALSELGVGKAVSGDFAPQAVADALHEAVEDPGYAQRALEFAERLHTRGPTDNVGKIVDGCLRLLSSDGRVKAG